MSRIADLGHRLYRGEANFGFVNRRRTWYIASGAALVIIALALGILGLNFGVEFTGGNVLRFNSAQATQSQLSDAASSVVDGQVKVQQVSGNTWRVETQDLPQQQLNTLQSTLAQKYHIDRSAITVQQVGGSWGGQISRKAGLSLVVFLALVAIYLSIAFEWKMAVSALIPLLHDLLITTGVYALVGFTVTPATVIGMLTILGYSLYDTVVVFDKVRENTNGLLGGSRMTYGQAANRAVNQVLMRSINTSVIVLLPVVAILVAGVTLLGTGPLKDLSLVLAIGIFAGTYSSIFLATPMLTNLKEREPQVRALAKRVAARQASRGQASQGNRQDKQDKQGGRAGGEAPAAREDGQQRDSGAPGGGGAADEEPAAGQSQVDDETRGPAPAGVGAPAFDRVVREGERRQPRRNSSKRRPNGSKKKK